MQYVVTVNCFNVLVHQSPEMKSAMAGVSVSEAANDGIPVLKMGTRIAPFSTQLLWFT